MLKYLQDDIITTWLMNLGILRWYIERKQAKKQAKYLNLNENDSKNSKDNKESEKDKKEAKKDKKSKKKNKKNKKPSKKKGKKKKGMSQEQVKDESRVNQG